ncbi:hypothetical protein V1L54_00705 [Streptomyces sp. TRM 70361]|uniref:hypothetical protein n=1 Tax=Streptomyces sp. TRM 70361 TaxID=3116553 RepID=UPI002E7B1C08|nr:hypothetical protein [Streptomyces sp. TRM 70361]MEE1937951.1 hypothetical protein [Streptomyces sp. TRM 70361]
MRHIAGQWCGPDARRRAVADAVAAALIAVGGLVLAGAATADPGPTPDTAVGATPHPGHLHDGGPGGPEGSAARAAG